MKMRIQLLMTAILVFAFTGSQNASASSEGYKKASKYMMPSHAETNSKPNQKRKIASSKHKKRAKHKKRKHKN